MKSPPTLVWAPAKGASYYNVQLIRAGRKVLSAWPTRTSFRLRRTWLYKGRRYRRSQAFTAGTSGPDTGGSPPPDMRLARSEAARSS